MPRCSDGRDLPSKKALEKNIETLLRAKEKIDGNQLGFLRDMWKHKLESSISAAAGGRCPTRPFHLNPRGLFQREDLKTLDTASSLVNVGIGSQPHAKSAS